MNITNVMIVMTRKTIDMDIPIYDIYVKKGSTSDGTQSSCLKQMSCKLYDVTYNVSELLEHYKSHPYLSYHKDSKVC